jgi:IclR family acetate operon transcriptional repressor
MECQTFKSRQGSVSYAIFQQLTRMNGYAIFLPQNGMEFRPAESKCVELFIQCMATDQKSGVQSVTRALSLLEIMADNPEECSLSEISEQANLPSSTVHRLLTSLMQVGYVAQDPSTNRYCLGNSLIRLSHVAVRKHNLIRIARPWLEKTAAQTGETVNLTTRFGDSVIQLDHVDSPNMLRVSYPAGERFPLHASASGKVFLAFMPQSELDQFLVRAPEAFTTSTVVDYQGLMQEIALTRSRGYALDDAERELGVRCVAAPINHSLGHVDAAISVSGPSVRISVQKLRRLAKDLIEVAATISQTRREPVRGPAQPS